MPIGANVYGLRTKALKTVCKVKKEIDTEIWGYLINRPELFNVKEIKVQKKYKENNFRLTLDEIDDYKFFQKLYNNFSKDEVIDLLDSYRFLRKKPQISFINNHVIQRDLDEKTKKRISKFYKKNQNKILKLKKEIYLK